MSRSAPAVADRGPSVHARSVAAQAPEIARLCHRMAERFARGGRLLAAASAPAARSDARHVAVEFVHPVIVGKRALPALAVIGAGAQPAQQLELLARPDDIVVAFGAGSDDGAAAQAIAAARRRGCETVAFAPGAGADSELGPGDVDPLVAQELVETIYHVLWELVHVFFEHRGLLAGRPAAPARADPGAAGFLYPFLAEREHDLDGVLEDVRRSVVMKSEQIAALRARTLADNAATLRSAADGLRAAFESGGTLLALGNGGSATDAMDLVADLRHPADGRRPRPAIDLTDDPAVLTAIANDIGVEAIFARQVIAYGTPGDVLVAITTSGNSANVIAALAQARRQGLATFALVGYDGGRIAAESLADEVIVVASEYIPRIQEAQASAYHVLCELADGG
jgi:D-sedoheptulose 7-phosphate isomerase